MTKSRSLLSHVAGALAQEVRRPVTPARQPLPRQVQPLPQQAEPVKWVPLPEIERLKEEAEALLVGETKIAHAAYAQGQRDLCVALIRKYGGKS